MLNTTACWVGVIKSVIYLIPLFFRSVGLSGFGYV